MSATVQAKGPSTTEQQSSTKRTVVAVLAAVSVAHLLNDLIQSLVVAVYPMLRESYSLSFGQLGLITLTYQLTASLLQPLVGFATDRRPQPYSLCVGMTSTLCGLLLLASATSLVALMFAATLIGMGSSIFHPEASRVARLASGGRFGLAQSIFQVGGNLGSSLGPLCAAVIVLPRGQGSISWFSIAALLAIVVLSLVGTWYRHHLRELAQRPKAAARSHDLPPARVKLAIAVLVALLFSKYVYLASMTNYYVFFLIDRFSLDVRTAQLHLFLFLAAIAAGTVLGGPIGDRFGRRRVIWFSILGVTPFTILLPHVGLTGTAILASLTGLILASAFSAILVYAQDLLPGRIGLVSGIFFGLAFGIAGIAAAGIGYLADHIGLAAVYQICSFLPLLGVLTVFLPDLEQPRQVS